MNDARAETTHLAELLRREHHAMAEFLVALSAFDRERRWEELGYASLFDFLRRELKLSAGAAQNRKAAAELVGRFPEVEAALRRGDLCLSSVNQVAKVLTPENVANVLPRFFGKSARDAEFVAASIRPVEDAPRREFLVTAVRVNPNREASGGPVVELAGVAPDGASVTLGAFHAYETTAAAAAPPAAPVPVSPAAIPDRPRIKPLDAERARVNMTVSRRLLEKLAAARDALSHSHPGASEEAILELGLDLIIARHRKRRGIGAKPRKRGVAASASAPVAASGPAPVTTSAAPVAASGPAPVTTSAAPVTASAPVPVTAGAPAPVASASSAPAFAGSALAGATPPAPPPPRRGSRHVPAAVWRGVWERDQGRCVWPLESGGVCGSTHRLELDHVGGVALGAGTTVEECRLLCRDHNLVHARALYGDAVMDRYLQPRGGPRCSEPVAAYCAARRGLDVGAGAPPRTSGRPDLAPATPQRSSRRRSAGALHGASRFSTRSWSGPPIGVSLRAMAGCVHRRGHVLRGPLAQGRGADSTRGAGARRLWHGPRGGG